MKHTMVVLGIVFAVLLACFLIYNRPLDGLGSMSLPLLKLTQDDVAAFQINNFADSYHFQKAPDGWFINRVTNELARSLDQDAGAAKQTMPSNDELLQMADPVAVTQLLTHLLLLETPEPIATRSNVAQIFQINPFSLHIVFYDEKGIELDRLFVGKQGPDLMSSFVKRGGSDAVYLVDQNLQGLMLKSFEDWLVKAEVKPENGQEAPKK